MANTDSFDFGVMTALFTRAGQRLEEICKAESLGDPRALPQEKVRELLRRSVVEIASTQFPTADVQALSHGFSAFTHPEFLPAMKRLRDSSGGDRDAFELASGVDAAIVLAGLGLMVAPFDRKQPRALAEPSNDIDAVISRFKSWKTAYVSYQSCRAPFYVIVTDCANTLLDRLQSEPRLEELRILCRRNGGFSVPRAPRPFTHAMALFPREPGDRISTLYLHDPNPKFGSIGIYAGWIEDGAPNGAPNNGYIPVPMQFLLGAIKDPETAMWIWRPVGAKSFMH